MPQPFDGNLVITQKFGERPWYYAKYGLRGHNGLDIIVEDSLGHHIWHPKLKSILPGVWHLLSERSLKAISLKNPQGWIGYGAAWILDFNEGNGKVKQLTFGHLQNRNKGLDGKNLAEGVEMAEMDNTGDSIGEHCHITLKQLFNGGVQNYTNGYHGAIDPLPFLESLGMKFIKTY